jgi:hypothetical protein
MSSKVCNHCNCPCKTLLRLQHPSTPGASRSPTSVNAMRRSLARVHGENGPPAASPSPTACRAGGGGVLTAAVGSGGCGRDDGGWLSLAARMGARRATGALPRSRDRRSRADSRRGCIDALHALTPADGPVGWARADVLVTATTATRPQLASAPATSAARPARAPWRLRGAGSPDASGERRVRRPCDVRLSGSLMTLRSRAPGCPSEGCSSSRLSHPSSCVMRAGVLSDTASSHEGSLFSLI